MTEAIDKLIQTRFNQLPEKLQQHTLSLDIPGIVSRGLRGTDAAVSNTRPLENELMLALLGFEPLSDLAHNVAENTQLSPQQADIFVSNVRVDAFSAVEDELERVWQKEEEKRKEEMDVPSPPVPPAPSTPQNEREVRPPDTKPPAPKPEDKTMPDTIHPQKPSTTQPSTRPEPPQPQTPQDSPEENKDEDLSAVSDMVEKKMTGPSSSAYPTHDPYREPIDDIDLENK